MIEETVVNHKYSTKDIVRSYQGHFKVKVAKIVKIYPLVIYFNTGSGAVIDYKELV